MVIHKKCLRKNQKRSSTINLTEFYYYYKIKIRRHRQGQSSWEGVLSLQHQWTMITERVDAPMDPRPFHATQTKGSIKVQTQTATGVLKRVHAMCSGYRPQRTITS